MNTELSLLGWSVVLGLIYIFAATILANQQRGLRYNVSNRDEPPKPLTGAAARGARALKNFLETFGFFAAAVLAVTEAGRLSSTTAFGAQLYFWARVVYLPVYLIGVPYLRTAVWAVSLAGLLMVLSGLYG